MTVPRGERVKKSENYADVIYGSPLRHSTIAEPFGIRNSLTEQFQVLPDGGGAVQERCGTREMGRAHDGGALGLQEVRTIILANQLNQQQGLA